MKFNFEKAKEEANKVVKKAVLAGGIALATAGAIGENNEASAQIKKEPIEVISVYDSLTIHQFAEKNIESPNWNPTVRIDFENEYKDPKKPLHLYIFRADGTDHVNKEISSLRDHVPVLPSATKIDSYEMKYRAGANSRHFQVIRDNEDTLKFKGVPAVLMLYSTDKTLLAAIKSTFGEKLKIDSTGKCATFSFPYQTQGEFYDELNRLIETINMYSNNLDDYRDKVEPEKQEDPQKPIFRKRKDD